MDGISQAEGEQSVEVLTQCGEKELVIHVATLMTQLNYVTIDEGRLPEKEGECFLDNQLCIAGDYQVGDRIALKSGTKDPLSDTLNHETYTIVGIGSSPYSSDKGSSTIGNGDIRGFVMVLPEEFKSDIYTQIYATCDSLKPYITASDAYFSAADQIRHRWRTLQGSAVRFVFLRCGRKRRIRSMTGSGQAGRQPRGGRRKTGRCKDADHRWRTGASGRPGTDCRK
ncbi:MAG: hypothetical protein V8S96_01155 [Lachnospiraceae bacterium]